LRGAAFQRASGLHESAWVEFPEAAKLR
jgi:hypothetical protein